ncbi:MAG: glutamine--fructose-6-phosphate transaminase (isomerizing) [Peptococcaceae bacterium]|jgi:glucosamine--fructose-6-phosphate aminotransferase (isomerizing)|nr:glutamine--fructose-6-phosphate transaminase (isomerizing) [Peptococcaceae bacterium]
MCGIVGYIGEKQVVPILLDGLKSLEYRGYDSAGIAVQETSGIGLYRSKGKIADLKEKIGERSISATVGIGHTRWATHGRPSDHNSHPHCDCKGRIAVVHNGIIENYLTLREELEGKGHVFLSETDTEVIPHLLEEVYAGNLYEAMYAVSKRLQGSYAIVAMCQENPDVLVAIRKDNPLIIGVGEGENFFASDIPAILAHTRKIMSIKDNDIAVIHKDKVEVFADNQPVAREITEITWNAEAAQKGGFAHFMLKEIFEQPMAVQQTLKGRVTGNGGKVDLQEVGMTADFMQTVNKVMVVACGTAYHAGLIGKYAMEKALRLPVEVDIASEFRYRDPIIDEHTLLIVVSQSGETADTLAALREGKKRGARCIAITNVLGSSISREADDVIYTWAGPEIAVASTKAYMTQLVAIYLLTIYLGQLLGRISPEQGKAWLTELSALPQKIQQILDSAIPEIEELAQDIASKRDVFFIGRGMDYAVALEGSLKLKEISYLRAEAYAAGELKHGTLALIEDGVPVVALCTQMDVYDKTVSNMKEIKARDAHLIGVGFAGEASLAKVVDHAIYIPKTDDFLSPILTVVPLQLLAYYTAVARGCDVDQPRNLAKSVTVE